MVVGNDKSVVTFLPSRADGDGNLVVSGSSVGSGCVLALSRKTTGCVGPGAVGVVMPSVFTDAMGVAGTVGIDR